VKISCQNLTLGWREFLSGNAHKLAVFLRFADYEFDSIFDCHASRIGVEALHQLKSAQRSRIAVALEGLASLGMHSRQNCLQTFSKFVCFGNKVSLAGKLHHGDTFF